VLPLVDHAQTVGLLDEGPLVCVAQEPVGTRQCKVNEYRGKYRGRG
jgi:hypothetical protein